MNAVTNVRQSAVPARREDSFRLAKNRSETRVRPPNNRTNSGISNSSNNTTAKNRAETRLRPLTTRTNSGISNSSNNTTAKNRSETRLRPLPTRANSGISNSSNNTTTADNNKLPSMERALGPGPMRFAPAQRERKVGRQMQLLGETERAMLIVLRAKWTQKAAQKQHWQDLQLTDEHILRYARACSFQPKTAWRVMQHYGESQVQRLLSLEAAQIEGQLRSQTLVPLPGLLTKQGHEVFYMKPSRFNPKENSTENLLENLGYVMNCMLEREHNASSGIAFLANMNDWTLEHFSPDYCRRFMALLQGHYFPVHVTTFLIVNPPKWLRKVWKLMKPTLSYRRKVHMIPESELFEHLPFQFERHLPNDLECGTVPTTALVEDFISYRLFVERRRQQENFPSTPSIRTTSTTSVKAVTQKGDPQQQFHHSGSSTHDLTDVSCRFEPGTTRREPGHSSDSISDVTTTTRTAGPNRSSSSIMKAPLQQRRQRLPRRTGRTTRQQLEQELEQELQLFHQQQQQQHTNA
jgi:hypothetical protein